MRRLRNIAAQSHTKHPLWQHRPHGIHVHYAEAMRERGAADGWTERHVCPLCLPGFRGSSPSTSPAEGPARQPPVRLCRASSRCQQDWSSFRARCPSAFTRGCRATLVPLRWHDSPLCIEKIKTTTRPKDFFLPSTNHVCVDSRPP